MRRRQFLTVALAAALACMTLMLAGCSGSSNYQPQLKSAEVAPPVIGEEGTLRVGVNTENPPLAGMGSGKIIGIDVDIASAMADQLGLKISIVDVGSDPAAAIADNKVDVVMGIDAANAESGYWASPSYLPTGIAVFALSADEGIPTADSGATFAAQVSSKSAWAVSNEFGESALTPTDTLKDAFVALRDGKVKYVAADAIIGLYAAHGLDGGLDVSIVSMLMKPSGYCMAVAANNTDLQTAAGDVLASLASNGAIDVIERKWLGTSVALDTLPIIGDGASSDGDSSNSDGSEEGSSDNADDGSSDEGTDTSGDDTSGDGDSGDGTGDDAGDTSDDSGDTGDTSGDEDSGIE
ncbi:transporter substrate-binding domain-containing protein [Eggerthellaceae bacterium 24-137]